MENKGQSKSWYAVITAKILYNKEINPRQKILLAMISNMSNEKGYCWASNQHFSELLNCNERTIQRDLEYLESKKILGRVINLKSDGSVDFRALTIIELVVTPMSGGGDTGVVGGGDTHVTYNNKDILITKKNKEDILPVEEKEEEFSDYDDFLESVNLIKNSRYLGCKESRRQFNARIKQGFTKQEMLEVLENAMKEKYHIETKFRFLTPEFCTRDTSIEKYKTQ